MQFGGQKGQDRWVVEEALPGRRDGYFLDLAATDGITINNTVYLERVLDWKGIAIEPNRDFYKRLKQNRSRICLDECIDERSGTVQFLPNGELGGIVDADTDNTPALRQPLIDHWTQEARLQLLPTRPLADVLDQYQAPGIIDYFSFDVEGAETRILRSFPFDRYTFLSLTIERPTPEVNETLFRHGYLFVRNESFDSFYVHGSAPTAKAIIREPFEQIPRKSW